MQPRLTNTIKKIHIAANNNNTNLRSKFRRHGEYCLPVITLEPEQLNFVKFGFLRLQLSEEKQLKGPAAFGGAGGVLEFAVLAWVFCEPSE